MSAGPPPPARDRAVPAWALASAALAPVAMIGGWTLAAALQPDGFDPVRETISALATGSMAAPAVMTAGLAVTGVCHVVTAAGLKPAAPVGRVLLVLGGVGTAAVAALPVDVLSRGHGIAAGVAFVALAVWPAASPRPGRAGGRAVPAAAQRHGIRSGAGGAGTSGLLDPRPARAASAVLVTLLVWFVLELQGLLPGDRALTGLTERLLAAAQSLWPLAVVLSLRPRRRR